jgi:catalase
VNYQQIPVNQPRVPVHSYSNVDEELGRKVAEGIGAE